MATLDLIEEAVRVEKESKFRNQLKKISELKERLDVIDSADWEMLSKVSGGLFKEPKPKPKYSYSYQSWGRRRRKRKVENATPEIKQTIGEKLLAKLDVEIQKLEKLVSLEKEFRVVHLDTTCKKKIPRPPRYPGEAYYKERLELWSNPKLAAEKKAEWDAKQAAAQAAREKIGKPGKRRAFKRISSHAQKEILKPIEEISVPLVWSAKLPAKPTATMRIGGYRHQAETPQPTPKATALLKKHKEKFDHMEVWWVPKNVLTAVIPKKQKVDPILVGVVELSTGPVYFELCRWMDENVEIGWWSKEGY